MSQSNPNVVAAETAAARLKDIVQNIATMESTYQDGCRVFVHFNGPTEQLNGVSMGMCVLDPGATPHPPHTHPEEEFLIIGDGTGEIECAGKTSQVGPGSVMYCDGNVLHGIVNTGKVPMTFYWMKWLAKGF